MKRPADAGSFLFLGFIICTPELRHHGDPDPFPDIAMTDEATPDAFEAFRQRRERGNEHLLATESLALKRFMALDKQVYADGALDTRTKELLGLVASAVLRCNDCIDYHLQRCVEEGFGKDEIDEAMTVALMVGGSIVIPHARHAAESMTFLTQERED